jgi:hypothetical protein
MQPGGVDQFVAARRAAQQSAASAVGSAGGADRTDVTEADRRQARKDVARVERRILRLTEQEEQLHAQMAADASDYIRLADLQAQLEAVTIEKDRLEEEWLAAAELVD